jgi:hypothetical protein
MTNNNMDKHPSLPAWRRSYLKKELAIVVVGMSFVYVLKLGFESLMTNYYFLIVMEPYNNSAINLEMN